MEIATLILAAVAVVSSASGWRAVAVTRARLNALRRNCYLTDTDGVRRRYGRVSPARQMEAER